VPIEPVRGVDGEWDEGLAPERTQLAWGRTGLGVMVAVAVLVRNVRTLDGAAGAAGAAGLVLVGAGALVWLAGMRASRRLEESMAPHGVAGTRAFSMIAGGTLLLALGGLVFGVLVVP